MDDNQGADICRVCRSEGLTDKPLFHPCICTGSIKWIHQECLVQWMRYSRKEYCELCGHRFSFTPIYSPDMPRRLPVRDVAGGLISSIATSVKYWIIYTIVALAWLGFVPLTACRIYRCLFTGSLDAFLHLPLDLMATENLPSDVFRGCFVVLCTLFAFIGLVWLRDQIMHGGGPEWLERENAPAQVDVPPVNPEMPENNNVREPDPVDEHEVQLAADRRHPAPVVHPQGAEGHVGANILQPFLPANLGGANMANNDMNPNNNAADAVDIGGAAADEGNWNQIELERAAEELTWERLLGLDGSFVFLEHVFWVVSLNTLFILLFAFFPYHYGHNIIVLLKLGDHVAASQFEGLITTLCGYCMIGITLVLLHYVASVTGMRKTERFLGLSYVAVKVSLLFVVEIGVVPLMYGWWLDICSLSMFDATLHDRISSFHAAPGTAMFIRWLVGMTYVYYFATFVLLLREVLRPGMLGFLRNVNDPDLSPVQEMICLPIYRHAIRLVASAVIFGTTVLLMLWLPMRILKVIWPTFLPYTVTLQNENQVNELSLELLLLQGILPTLLEQSHTRRWLKNLARAWCQGIAWLLDLHSYLLGDERMTDGRDGTNVNNNVADDVVGGNVDLAAAHQAFARMRARTGFQPYTKPPLFAARVAGLLIAAAITLVITSLIAFTVPVWIGRHIMSIWFTSSFPSDTTGNASARVHELYTAACGTYICWITARTVTLLLNWFKQGRAAIVALVKQWCIIGSKAFIALLILFGVIPLMFGLFLELVIVIPLRVPLHQTPVIFVRQDWALGVLYTKIACAVIMMGPDWPIRRALERAYGDGFRGIDLLFIIKELACPVIAFFGLALAVPYAISNGVVPLIVTNLHFKNFIKRRLYPAILLLSVVACVIIFQIRQFHKLYEHIKNDKYLVDRRLVNYDHRRHKSPTGRVQVQQ